MRTIDITINDLAISFRSGSARVSRATGERGTAEFEIEDTKQIPEEGQTVGVFDHGLRVFGGTIHEIRRSPVVTRPSAPAWYRCLCTSWEHRLEKIRIPAAAYYEKGAGEIVADLLNGYAPNEVHGAVILPGVNSDTLGTVIFRGVSIADAITDLAERSKYIWYIDPDLVLYFGPRELREVALEVTAENANYREPEITTQRADYFNKVSLAISYDAFPPISLSLAGDLTYPSFTLFDPADPFQVPTPVDQIRKILLNGVEQTFAVKDSGDTKTFYYIPGQPTIWWDALEPTPSPADVITVEFYAIGANIVTVSDDDEILARATKDYNQGIYHAYLEDFDITNVEQAQLKCQAFLDLHAPARTEPNRNRGDLPREFAWTMFSHELRDGTTLSVEDLWPGKIIRFKPSTPTTDDCRVVIQSVEMQDVPAATSDGEGPGAGIFRYDITATDTTKIANYLDFYKALAEVGGGAGIAPTVPSLTRNEARVVLGISGAVAVADGFADITLSLPPGKVFRCLWVEANVTTAPAGANMLLDLQYSTDPPSTAEGDRTWNNCFGSSAGEVIIPDGQQQMTLPYAQFVGFPDTPLDIPARAIVRGNVKQVGSGTAGSDLKLQLVGEIRAAT